MTEWSFFGCDETLIVPDMTISVGGLAQAPLLLIRSGFIRTELHWGSGIAFNDLLSLDNDSLLRHNRQLGPRLDGVDGTR